MKSCIFSLACLAIIFGIQCETRAGIVITTTVSQIATTANDTTFSVSAYGQQAGANPGNELNVSTFGLRISIVGATPASITAATNAPAPSQWAQMTTAVAPTSTASSVTFRSYVSPDSNNVAMLASGINNTTLIGTFTVTVNKTNVPQTFSAVASADTALRSDGVTIAGSGFLQNKTGFFENLDHVVGITSYPGVGSPAVGTGAITAVPEPSSLALLALVPCYAVVRRRFAKKPAVS